MIGNIRQRLWPIFSSRTEASAEEMGRRKDAELHKERGIKRQNGFALETRVKACANVESPGMRTIFAKRFKSIYTQHCLEDAKNG
jgi:hypothetical protein